MKLKYIGAMLDNVEFEWPVGSDFRFKNRFVGNYLTRALKEEKIESADFNSIAIKGRRSETKDTYFLKNF